MIIIEGKTKFVAKFMRSCAHDRRGTFHGKTKHSRLPQRHCLPTRKSGTGGNSPRPRGAMQLIFVIFYVSQNS